MKLQTLIGIVSLIGGSTLIALPSNSQLANNQDQEFFVELSGENRDYQALRDNPIEFQPNEYSLVEYQNKNFFLELAGNKDNVFNSN